MDFKFFNYKIFKKAKKPVIYLLAIIVLLFLSWFIFRINILNYVWHKAEVKFERKGYNLACSKKGFTGLFTVKLTDLTLQFKTDTLLYSREIYATISVWKSVFLKPSLSELSLNNTNITLINKPDYCNYCNLKPDKKNQTGDLKSQPLAQRLFNLLETGLGQIPAKISNKSLNISYSDSSDNFGLSIPSLVYHHNEIKGIFNFNENGYKTGFNISGNLNRRKINGQLEIKPQIGKWVELPVLKRKLGISTGFEKANFKLEELEMSNGILHVVADGEFQGITINDKRVADTNVVINNCSGKIVANFGSDFIEIDSATSLSLNKIKTTLYLKAGLGKNPEYIVKFDAPKLSANHFFQSLPTGMFSHLQGLEATGFLEYHLFLHLKHTEPHNVKLESELKPENFKITKMGNADLRKMNGSFVHTFYERGKPVRTFTIGPSNPSFTPLEQIPETLQKAIMTGEDPAFYSHNGFYQEAFRQSIAQNYIRRRFARGGSTISMQLVKNVFLSRKKTIARKAEEMLIVWLIESQRLTSKARMFEVYLNAIEWGPGVFGVGEAASFYFSKHPSELQSLECVFLASIVPSPKSYRYFLDSTGNVSERNWNFVAIRNRMIQKGILDSADSANFNVKIKGPAANYLRKDEPDEEEKELLKDLLNPIRKPDQS